MYRGYGAAVENNLYPYFPGRPPAQIKTEQIIVDRTPEAAISLSPPSKRTTTARR